MSRRLSLLVRFFRSSSHRCLLAVQVQYQLKMKASRELLSEVQKKYPTMLFR